MKANEQKPAVLWFRKDLRLDDNHALHMTTQTGRPVIPIYIREPPTLGAGSLGRAQDWWLHHSLTALQENLRRLGSSLIFRSGDALSVLSQILEETGADTLVWNRRYDPASIAVDTRIKDVLRGRGIDVRSFAGQLLHEPSRLLTGTGNGYRTYASFWQALEKSGEPPPCVDAPRAMNIPASWPTSERLDDWGLLPGGPNWAGGFSEVWVPGEASARDRLLHFIETAFDGYRRNRDFPGEQATSLLSPHLAMGEISPARIWQATLDLRGKIPAEDIVHFRKELAWREFSHHQLFHFPKLCSMNWNSRYDDFPWRSEPRLFALWSRGQTGYPIIDAGMRQLWRHGWMHNRVRMIVASFLVKDLLIDWRQGEAWFRDTLVDADAANNAANWQWVAGSGADASPFFRIFNPVLQGEKFDPEGRYVREFVPELSRLDNRYIHRPFDAPAASLAQASVTLGKNYPLPIIDHAGARQRALAAHAAMRGA
ncbi:deoxyribodipyrimidine photo-lyase [Rhizobium sp. BK602]|uniref:cryptochrome/photolyase family protein n=1 Tax=Rhizobium sp. BK602 TaxID=2586986 RepID=UPI0017AA8CC3|nr:deoxyribodipyrimidine photo-lyase [Rhizobium sp. BK602]MBB3608083.1 deoxyribodipyrimidine photo-lyase [Rhizobium sp. BK602]